MAGRSKVRYNGHPAWDRLDPEEWPAAALNGPRARAKQTQMLEADLEHAILWVETMQKLVDEQLADEEFTMRRLIALKEWEKSRHRAQKALNYRYNPLERPKRLIERDTDRALQNVLAKREKLRAKIEEMQALRAASRPPLTAPLPEPAEDPPASQVRNTRPPAQTIRSRTEGTLHPGLASLDPLDRQMFQDLAPDTDIATTSDDELRRRWKERSPGMADELIDTVIGKINGTIPSLEELVRDE